MSAGARARAHHARTATRATALAAALVVGAATLTACGSTPDESHGGGTAAPPEQTLTVLAAASLRDVLTDLGTDFEDAHPGVTVRFSFAGSNDLADQVLAGSPADVLATADETTMQRVVDGGEASDPVVFATNTLVVAVPAGNPAGIEDFADLADDDAKVVVCAPEVPCGAAAATVEKEAGVSVHAVSEEASVTDVLAKVTSGEADAGLVYATDATLAGDAVEVVPTPETATVVNRYPAVALDGAADPALARTFVDLLTGSDGQAALADAGFGAP